MKKVVPIKSAERELRKFRRAVDDFQCQLEDHQFDQIANELLETPKQPSAGAPEGLHRPDKKQGTGE